jgi:ribonuclease H / adenosylcobalamin/alpha-ribazole phosphatase
MGSLVLVRHSITAASASGRNLGRRADPPLATAGMAVAEILGRTLAAELAELPHDEVRLVTSPALRCRQTMEQIRGALGLQPDAIEVEPAIIEIDYGAWDGLTAEECIARDQELRRAWIADPYHTRCPDGESGEDVARRAFPVFHEIEAWLAHDRARCAVVVAHNHVNRLRITALLAWPMRDYRRRVAQDPAGYSLISHGAGLPGVRRINAPATIHLPAGD